MTTQLLAQAVAVAYNPNSSPEQLMEVVGDLMMLGALDAADEALRRLRAAGRELALITRLERVVRWFRILGPIFEERRLVGAIAVTRDADATDDQLRLAADSLVMWGALDEADVALARLKERGAFPGPVARISAASRQLRRSGIMEELQTLTPRKSLNKPYEVLVKRRPGGKRAIIVFTGIVRRFWLSLNALHVFLRRFDAHVIYLNDHSGAVFMNGLQSVGPGYESLLGMLREQLTLLAARDVYVLATSGAGFVGLRVAVDLEAEAFAGMSIRTDLSPSSPIQTSPFERFIIGACRDPGMLIDLRPVVEASKFPRRIQLYTGDENRTDVAHTENLRGIPRVEINYLESHKRHDAVSALIARGTFTEVLKRFVDGDSAVPTNAD
jgi:hypothetical protein